MSSSLWLELVTCVCSISCCAHQFVPDSLKSLHQKFIFRTLKLILPPYHVSTHILIKGRGFSWHVIYKNQSPALLILGHLVYVIYVYGDCLVPAIDNQEVVSIFALDELHL